MKKKFSENLIDNIENSATKMSKSKIFNFTLRVKTVIILFVLLIIAITCLSVYFVINDEENLLNFSTTSAESTSDSNSVVSTFSTSIDVDVLFMITDDTPEDIDLLMLVNINTETYELSYKFISPDEKVTIGSETMSLQNYFTQYGLTQLITGVATYVNDDVERYVSMTHSNFSTMLAYISNVQVEIEEDFTYSYNGINYVFSEGVQILSTDMMTKYVLYLSDLGVSGETEIVDIISQCVLEFFETRTVEEGYDRLINMISSNISAYDIVEHQKLLEEFLSSEDEKTISIESTDDVQ